MKQKTYTKKEIKIIKQNYFKLKYADLVKLLPGRTIRAVTLQIAKLGLRKSRAHKKWTPEEDNLLKKYYGTISNADLVDKLPERLANHLKDRAMKLKLTSPVRSPKNKWTQKEIELLKKYYPRMGIKMAHFLPKRSPHLIAKRAHMLKIKRISKGSQKGSQK